eukprot:5705166-Pyramimonas_sp.AAC.1
MGTRLVYIAAVRGTLTVPGEPVVVVGLLLYTAAIRGTLTVPGEPVDVVGLLLYTAAIRGTLTVPGEPVDVVGLLLFTVAIRGTLSVPGEPVDVVGQREWHDGADAEQQNHLEGVLAQHAANSGSVPVSTRSVRALLISNGTCVSEHWVVRQICPKLAGLSPRTRRRSASKSSARHQDQEGRVKKQSLQW